MTHRFRESIGNLVGNGSRPWGTALGAPGPLLAGPNHHNGPAQRDTPAPVPPATGPCRRWPPTPALEKAANPKKPQRRPPKRRLSARQQPLARRPGGPPARLPLPGAQVSVISSAARRHSSARPAAPRRGRQHRVPRTAPEASRLTGQRQPAHPRTVNPGVATVETAVIRNMVPVASNTHAKSLCSTKPKAKGVLIEASGSG